MKTVIAALLLAVMGQSAFAETCEDGFARLLAERNPDRGPVRIHIFQEIVGMMKSENYHYSMGNGTMDGMTEMIEPENMMWSLFLGNKMYSSSDKGKTWDFVREMDAASDPEAVKAKLREDAKTASGVACASEELDGKAFDTVEGDYVSSMLQGASVHQKYWVEPDTGIIGKVTTNTKAQGVESNFTQIIEPWTDPKLPTPE